MSVQRPPGAVLRHLGCLDPFDHRRASRQIVDLLTTAIDDELLPPRTQLPDVLAMARHYGTTRMTVRTAIEHLRRQELVLVAPYRGVWVWPGPPRGEIDLMDPTLLHEQLARLLTAAIARGRYPAGKALPGRQPLADRYGVAPKTAQKAITLLVARGVVRTVPRTETYVVMPPQEWASSPSR